MSRRTVQGAVLSLVIVSGVLVSSAQDAKLAGRPAQANVPLTLDEVLGTPSVSNLVTAPSGRAVAWVLSDHGRRNVWVAEGDALRPRRLTTFAEDDGQSIQGLCWTPDARAVVFVRGAPTGASGAALNPTSDIAPAAQGIWMARLDGAAPREIARGTSPVVSPRGDLIAFLNRGEVWAAPVAAGGAPADRLFRANGQASGLSWSPDGDALAFTSSRGDHALIGVFHRNRRTIEYISPGADRDLYPRWSDDSTSLAFVRIENIDSDAALSSRSGSLDSPWALLVATRDRADGAFGAASEVWRAPTRPGGSFARAFPVLEWMDGHRLIFTSEHEDWAHLYAIDVGRHGATPVLLTPGACEVDDVERSVDRRSLFVVSNCGDLERRHLWKVSFPLTGSVSTSVPQRLVPGSGVETSPVVTADGRSLVFLNGDGRTPALPHVLSLADSSVVPLPADVLSPSFPRERLVEPQVATFTAPDGLEIHGVLYAPPTDPGAAPGRHAALVHVHGGPTRSQELLSWQGIYQLYVSRGYVVLGLNYRGGSGYGRRFREVPNRASEGTSEYQDVVAAARYLRSRADVDPARIGIWGTSYGGYLTQLALARNSDLFAAGVSEAGMFEMVSPRRDPSPEAVRLARQSSAAGNIDTWRSPVLIIHGDDDGVVDFNQQTVPLVRALRAHRIPFELLVIPDEGHGSAVFAHARLAHQATADFFARKLAERISPSNR